MRILIEALSLAYGHILWATRPDVARSLLFSKAKGFRGGAARRYYLKVIEPTLAGLELATTRHDSPCEKLVVPADFEAVRDIFHRRGYEENGILPLEAVVLWALVRTYRPDVLFESGTYRGQSAVLLCEAIARNSRHPEFHTVSPNDDGSHDVARRRLSGFQFATIHEGFSEAIFPVLLDQVGSRTVAVFMDGPKGDLDAFTSVLQAIDHPDTVSFVAIHDCEWSPPAPGLAIVAEKLERLRIQEWYDRSKMRQTHDLWFMDSAWCERHAFAWEMLPSNAPGGIGPHCFAGHNQLSATAVLGVIARRN